MNKATLLAVTVCSLTFANEKTSVYVTDVDHRNNSIEIANREVLKKQIIFGFSQSDQYQVTALYEDCHAVVTEIIETDEYLALSLELIDEDGVVVNSTLNYFDDFDSIDKYISTVVENLITDDSVRVNYGTTRHMGDLEKGVRYIFGAGFGMLGIEFGK